MRSIDLVVAGDVVYNQCHMYVGDTTPESRENWIAALDRLAALNPKIVVAGHKKPGAPDTPAAIEATKRYLRDFGRLKESSASDRELFDAMTERYPDWVSHQTWLMFGLAPPPRCTLGCRRRGAERGLPTSVQPRPGRPGAVGPRRWSA